MRSYRTLRREREWSNIENRGNEMGWDLKKDYRDSVGGGAE